MSMLTLSSGLSNSLARSEIGLWSGAAALVLAAHLAGAYYLTRVEVPVAPPAEAAPAIEIEIAPMMVAPEAVPTEMAELVDSTPTDPVEDPVETVEEQPPVETVVETPAEEVEETAPEVVDEVVPDTVEEVVQDEPLEAVTEEEVTEQEVAEEFPTDFVPVPRPEVVLETPPPKPEVRKVVRPAPAKVRKPEVKKPPRKAPAPPQRTASTKSAEAAPRTAAPRAAQGTGGTSVSPARWQSRVNAHLNRYKRSIRGSGTVTVSFVIDPSGNVLSARVARSSGDPTVDEAAVSLVRRASPVPAPPPQIARARMPLAVPVNFRR